MTGALPTPEMKTFATRLISPSRWSNDDFLESIRERATRREKGLNPLSKKLADWTDREIMEALDAALSDPGVMLAGGPGHGLTDFLFAEWMRRDLPTAIAWFDKLESRSAQGELALQLFRYWPPDKPEEAFAFFRSHPGMFASFESIFAYLVGHRARQGTGAVEELLQIMREEKINLEVTLPVVFPQGFDFRSLAGTAEFSALWDRGGGTMFMRGWSEQDRDAAFDWLLENHGVESISANNLTMKQGGDHTEHSQWLAARIQQLEPAELSQYVRQNRRNWLQSPERLIGFAQGISDPGALDELHAIGVQSIYGGNSATALSLLEGIEDPEKRIELLETTPPLSRDEAMMIGHHFDKVDEHQLREKLVKWNASEERIGTIINRFK